MTQKQLKKKQDKIVDALYNKYFNGVQINIMDSIAISNEIGSFLNFDEVALNTAMINLVAKYRQN